MDLDHFKAINDEHGHETGDAVLKQAAYRMRTELRAYDLAYRLGGEEFLIVMPGADARRAEQVADELRKAIADRPISGIEVTMSVGVSASSARDFDYTRLFAQSDEALYAAKHAGRSKVCVFEDDPGRAGEHEGVRGRRNASPTSVEPVS